MTVKSNSRIDIGSHYGSRPKYALGIIVWLLRPILKMFLKNKSKKQNLLDKEKNRMSSDEFDRLMRTHPPQPMDEEDIMIGKLSKKISFLSAMIAGDFEGATENSFKSEEEKRFFKEFNKLSQPEKVNTCNKLENALAKLI